MSVYVRYPCPNCSRNLNLRLEYINRRVICNHCKQSFVSRAKIRVPAAAAPELVDAIDARNREQGFSWEADEDDGESSVVLDLTSSGGRDAVTRALAEVEARHTRQLNQLRVRWERQHRSLEHEADLIGVHYSRELDLERAYHARQRERLQAERDQALQRVEELVHAQKELSERLGAVERLALRAAELEQALANAGIQPAGELNSLDPSHRKVLAETVEQASQACDALSQTLRTGNPLAADASKASQGSTLGESAYSGSGERGAGPGSSTGQEGQIASELAQARREESAELGRCSELARRLESLDRELTQTRRTYESEVQVRGYAVEMLGSLLGARSSLGKKTSPTPSSSPSEPGLHSDQTQV